MISMQTKMSQKERKRLQKLNASSVLADTVATTATFTSQPAALVISNTSRIESMTIRDNSPDSNTTIESTQSIVTSSTSIKTSTTFSTGTSVVSNKQKQRSAHFDAPWPCRAVQTCPRIDRLLPGEPVSFDAEFQLYKHEIDAKWSERLGCVALTNTKGEVIYNAYCAYPHEDGVEKKMPRKDGKDVFRMDKRDLLFKNGAIPAGECERIIAEILKGRTVIVHGGEHDRTCLQYQTNAFTNAKEVVDTQDFYGRRRLKDLAWEQFGEVIQEEEHTAVEDAQAAMKLYLKKRPYDRDAELERIKREAPETLVPIPLAAPARGGGNRGGSTGRGRGRRSGGRHDGRLRKQQAVKDDKSHLLSGSKAEVSETVDYSLTDEFDFPALDALLASKKGGRR